MITTIIDNINGAIFTQEGILGDDIGHELMSVFDFTYDNVFDKSDEIIINVESHDEYYKLDTMIAMQMYDMENSPSPVWFDRMLLIALINAKYDYLYEGYDFDDYNFDKFKEARGL